MINKVKELQNDLTRAVARAIARQCACSIAFMSIADVIIIFHFRKTMRYISLFCLVTYFQILHAVLHRYKNFHYTKNRKFCNAKNILPQSTTFSNFP
jgi:hypothetical protein